MRASVLVVAGFVSACVGSGGDATSTASSTSNGGPNGCTPNQQVECPCPGSLPGVQRCTADGRGFTECTCGAPDAGHTRDAGLRDAAPTIGPTNVVFREGFPCVQRAFTYISTGEPGYTFDFALGGHNDGELGALRVVNDVVGEPPYPGGPIPTATVEFGPYVAPALADISIEAAGESVTRFTRFRFRIESLRSLGVDVVTTHDVEVELPFAPANATLCRGQDAGFDAGPQCGVGYRSNGFTCIDINGCVPNPCFAGVTCTDNSAPNTGATCGPCPQGYSGDGFTCVDIDECANNNGNCGPVEAAECRNNIGGPPTCSDIDGCAASPCFATVQCTDVAAPGAGFTCGPCPNGFTGSGLTCADVDECATDNGGCGDPTAWTCINQLGAAALCDNVDGCAETPCFANVLCFDQPAPSTGFICGPCPPGMSGDGIACVEIDGCANAPCFAGLACTDIPAPDDGFSCEPCPRGYVGDGITCIDDNECEPSPCFAGVECTDVPVPGFGFSCAACPAGYFGNGVQCFEYNECAPYPCDNSSTCIDMIDGYACRCLIGYQGDLCSTSTFQPATGTFATGTQLEIPGNPYQIAAGDFDGDGLPDIAAPHYGENPGERGLTLFFNNGDRTFSTRSYADFGSGRILAMDITGDGHVDLVMPALVYRNLGDGSGLFSQIDLRPATYNTYDTADFDGNGRPDLVVFEDATRLLRVLRWNDTLENFEPVSEVAVPGSVGSLAVGDVNRDGNDDVVVGCYDPWAIFVFRGDGDGMLTHATTIVTPASRYNASALAILDFNRDGDMDVLAGFSNGGVGIYFGQGVMTFSPEQAIDAATYWSVDDIRLGDFTGDTNLDVIFCESSIGSVTLLPGMPQGGVGTAIRNTAGTFTAKIDVADFDLDGIADVVVSVPSPRSVAVMYGQ